MVIAEPPDISYPSLRYKLIPSFPFQSVKYPG
jgi:hypothetical protein